ncbi:MAG: 2OG-Fe(II) oxygenase [Hyphomicrobiaceae bacterium]|nr:2OG-Fe(II) oxygenase [Hyphomicrobiaceae bacterium]
MLLRSSMSMTSALFGFQGKGVDGGDGARPPAMQQGEAAAHLTFAADRLEVQAPALPAEAFERLKEAIEGLVDTERSYLPTHKKGGTVAYSTLRQSAPGVVEVYRSAELVTRVSAITGVAVVPTPERDESSCSVLFYERPGDHIGWHYDHNFYRGRHFTVLIPILNRGWRAGGLSSARLEARRRREVVEVPTRPNSLIVFEGQAVLHRVTPIAADERRIMLSMTYCADPRASRVQDLKRRVKDVAFFGPRALWS